MLATPSIIDLPAQRTAVIHLTIPRAHIRDVMGPGINELMDVVKAQAIGPVGHWFMHHHEIHPDIFDFDLGVPVSGPVKTSGRVTGGELRATRAARTVVHGAYENLPAAWGEFSKWITAQGLQGSPDLWEIYVRGPESSADPSTWETELIQPLLD